MLVCQLCISAFSVYFRKSFARVSSLLFQGAESPSCSSSDSDASVSSRSSRVRRLSQQQRNLQTIRRRDYVRRLTGQSKQDIRLEVIMKCKFLLSLPLIISQ